MTILSSDSTFTAVTGAIATVAVEGTRRPDGKVEIGDEVLDDFPKQIRIEGMSFDLTEEELVGEGDGYTLAHYFRRDGSPT